MRADEFVDIWKDRELNDTILEVVDRYSDDIKSRRHILAKIAIAFGEAENHRTVEFYKTMARIVAKKENEYLKFG